jgi:3',5'-cyclic AMP phosphodiesterase CpdA
MSGKKVERFRFAAYKGRMKRFCLFLLVLCAAGLGFAQEVLRFVQLTDTHFGQGDHFERVEKMVRQINKLPESVDFVVITGDIMNNSVTNTALVDRVFQTLEKLKMPVHFLPGNHDLLADDPQATVAAYTNRFGPLVSSVPYNGIDCIFICTEPLAAGVQVDGFDPLVELEERLSERPALVFHHIPSVDNFYGGKAHPGWGRTEEGFQWVALLNRYPVKGVFAGHFHRDGFYWLGEVPLFVAPPVSGRFGQPGAFRVYEYKNGQINYCTVYAN